jgi:hypothetical protein
LRACRRDGIVFGKHDQQIVDRQRFRQIIVAACFEAAFPVTHHRVGGHRNYGRLEANPTQMAHHLQAADLASQFDVHQDQVELFPDKLLQGDLTLGIGHDGVTVHAADPLDQSQVRWIIFYIGDAHGINLVVLPFPQCGPAR